VSTIPASLVKELRAQTGAGMMDCKRALEQTGGDLEAARQLLRERGVAQAGKRAGRDTTEGKVGYRIRDSRGTMVAIGCETEPVSNNEEFLAFAKRVLEVVEEEGSEAASSLEQERLELIGKLGENVVVAGAVRLDAGEGEQLAGYAHPPANKIGVLVQARGGTPETARRLAMHIAFADPTYVSRADVPDDQVAAERAVYEQRPEVQSKPEHVRGRIVEGMLGKGFFAEAVLADQPWIHDTAKTVGQALQEAGLEVVKFERYALTG
jgi:elongation factor Ts